MIAPVYYSSFSGGGWEVVQSQPRQKFSETPISTKKSGAVSHTWNPSYMKGISRRIMSDAGLRPETEDPV
jgi:hypothetical protein